MDALRPTRKRPGLLTRSLKPGTLMAQCGDKPKRIAFGVAPLGIISISIVPMGVVVAGVHAMGIWSLTPGSGHPHHSSGDAQQQLLA